MDECHLVWGDICGYIWGRTDRRIEINVKNEKERQTYYGAINYRNGKVFTKEYPQGNTENTIKFVSELIKENKNKRLLIMALPTVWGKKYNRLHT